MKVIIPVAGFGTRLRPHTLTKPKVLLNVGGKPMIHYIIEQLLRDKLATSIVLVTGFLGDMIRNYLDGAFRFRFDYVVQDEPKGLGHAVHCAKQCFDSNDETLIILGDTLFDVDLKSMIRSDCSVIGVKKVDDPRRFGVVEKNRRAMITRFVEKPASKEVSPSNEAIVGLYYLKNSESLFDSLEHVMRHKITTRGEYQLTDALEHMLSKNERMTTYDVHGWLDCGKPETLLETNRYILAKKKRQKLNYPGSLIINPVHIGKNVKISRSIIGPDVTLNDGCIVENCIISNSVIEQNAMLSGVTASSSIIGESAKIISSPQTLNIGSFTEIIHNSTNE